MLSLALHLNRCSPLHAESRVFAKGFCSYPLKVGKEHVTNGHCFLEDELAKRLKPTALRNLNPTSVFFPFHEKCPELSTQDMDIVMLPQHSLSARRLSLCCVSCSVRFGDLTKIHGKFIFSYHFSSQTFTETS